MYVPCKHKQSNDFTLPPPSADKDNCWTKHQSHWGTERSGQRKVTYSTSRMSIKHSTCPAFSFSWVLWVAKLAWPGIQEYINEIHRKQAVREERLGKQPCLLLTSSIWPLHLEQHGKKTMAYFIREHTIAPWLDYLQHIFIFIERETERNLQYLLIIILSEVLKKNYYKTSE